MLLAQVAGGLHGGQGVQVDDAVDAVVLILQRDIVLDGAQVVAQVLATGRPGAGKNASFFHSVLVVLLSLFDFLNQTADFALFRVALGLELGIDQLAVDLDLEPAFRGGHQCEGLDLGFKFLEQFGHQTGGPWGVVSDCAVGNGDF